MATDAEIQQQPDGCKSQGLDDAYLERIAKLCTKGRSWSDSVKEFATKCSDKGELVTYQPMWADRIGDLIADLTTALADVSIAFIHKHKEQRSEAPID